MAKTKTTHQKTKLPERKSFLSKLGPGFITGAADDDPSGIATYSQTGAQFGLSHTWMALFSLPFMVVIQEMCGRIGLVTGHGLSGVIRNHYSKTILFTIVGLVFVANVVNIGANLGAMAASANMVISGISFIWWLFIFALLVVLSEIFLPYRTYAKVLQVLALCLFAYVVTTFIIQPDWLAVAKSTLLPKLTFDESSILNIVAILGTTISPYLFFWQASEEVEENIDQHRIQLTGKGLPRITPRDIGNMRLDTFIGMFFSNAVMFFVIVAAAFTLHPAGITTVDSPVQAAQALLPLAGVGSYVLFTIGIIGVGLLSIPVLAGAASYAVSEAIGWKAGLYNKFSQARPFYWVIVIATIVGLAINFTDIPPFTLLYYTAVLNGLCAPFVMALIIMISNNPKIMGKYVNTPLRNWIGWIITFLMTAAGVYLIYTLLT